MFHSFADAHCYLPLAQDLLHMYDVARDYVPCILPPIGNVFEELQSRLMDTFDGWKSSKRCSLRGCIFAYQGGNYSHCVSLQPALTRVLALAAMRYRVPLYVALFGFVLCAMARADGVDVLDLTLYTPMRDGGAEAMMVGFFADWRDLCVSVDFDMATTLGTI